MGSMTDVNIGMVPYYNPLAMYRQPPPPPPPSSQHLQQSPAVGATDAQQQQQQQQQQQLAAQAHQQAAHAQHAVAMQQQAAAAAAAAADLTSAQQYWYGYRHPASLHHHHHQASPPSANQYLEHPSDVLSWPHHSHYAQHLQYQHQQHAAYQQHQQHQQQQQQQAQLSCAASDWSGDDSSSHHHSQQRPLDLGDTSPPRTVSGSEISSPGTPASPSNNNNNPNLANNNNNNNNNNNEGETGTSIKVEQVASPFEWMNKPSYQSQSNPGKTRTKDKYRVVYTDHQRLELEKEFHFSRYITIRRKSELAANLALSERQVKIWFQNRRAKERKQSKKREELEQKDAKPTIDMDGPGGMVSHLGALGGMSGMLGGLMHNGGSPPLSLGPPQPPPHNLAAYSASALHSLQHAHSHPVMGL